jgi:hypothetical protein
VIKLRNIGVDPSIGVVVNNALPTGLEFLESIPFPSSQSGNALTYNIGTLESGESRQIVIKAELGPTAVAGQTLVNRTTAFDDAGNFAQKTFTGGIRSGAPPSAGRLEVALTTVRRIVAGTKLKSSISITNGARGDANDVMVTLDGPPDLELLGDQTIPGPVSEQLIDGKRRWTWIFPRVNGPGNETIKTTHVVPEDAAGTSFNLTARVSAPDGRNDQESATVEVRE